MDFAEKLQKACEYIRSITDFRPQAALVLGSGLGEFAEKIEIYTEIPYMEIPGFPVSTVPGHAGKYLFGKIEGVPVVVMCGRVHYYEGYEMRDVVMPIRIMGMLGAKILLLTNAAGGINLEFSAGTLMLLRDHISSFVPSPLIGKNSELLGERFPDMTEVYDKKLCNMMRNAAEQQGISMREGVYVQVTGPQYETPQEIEMFRMFGADAVGMSTVCEAIAARHMGMRVCAVSCITNMAAGICTGHLSHEEVQKCAERVSGQFRKLIREFFREMRNV